MHEHKGVMEMFIKISMNACLKVVMVVLARARFNIWHSKNKDKKYSYIENNKNKTVSGYF